MGYDKPNKKILGDLEKKSLHFFASLVREARDAVSGQ